MDIDIKLPLLHQILYESWGQDTASGEWNTDNPSLNQCAVTALVVQDYFGGVLMRCPTTDGGSHYWNRLPEGYEFDLTAEQFLFGQREPISSRKTIRDREYVLSFPDTLKRYHILSARVRIKLLIKEVIDECRL